MTQSEVSFSFDHEINDYEEFAKSMASKPRFSRIVAEFSPIYNEKEGSIGISIPYDKDAEHGTMYLHIEAEEARFLAKSILLLLECSNE